MGAETDSLEQALQALWLVNHDLVSLSRDQRDKYSYTGMKGRIKLSIMNFTSRFFSLKSLESFGPF